MALDALLACPRCDTALIRDGDHFGCGPCHTDFPSLAGIPFLFSEPDYALGQWRSRLRFEQRQLEHDEQRANRALDQSGLSELTRQRLKLLRSAYQEHRRLLTQLLQPLELAEPGAAIETYLALRTRLPTDQGLNTYYQNVHRDWCWGEEENRHSFELVNDALTDEPGKVLVLGAGASRLAYDIHQGSGAALTIAMDFNPLLLILAKQIMSGTPVQLYEFPIAPRTLADHAVLRTLTIDTPVRDGFHFVLADALRPPFNAGSFDTVITPWLTDILPEDFGLIAARINGLLTDGGRWINFGSMAFTQPEPSACYSAEEAFALVSANGFSEPAVKETTIPYMCSPASRHGRQERVVTFVADKLRGIKRPTRHKALPDWLVKADQPVPNTHAFQMQAVSTRVHAFVMGMIDGRRSIKDMAKLMHDQKLMARDEAEPVIRDFLIKMYDQR